MGSPVWIGGRKESKRNLRWTSWLAYTTVIRERVLRSPPRRSKHKEKDLTTLISEVLHPKPRGFAGRQAKPQSFTDQNWQAYSHCQLPTLDIY